MHEWLFSSYKLMKSYTNKLIKWRFSACSPEGFLYPKNLELLQANSIIIMGFFAQPLQKVYSREHPTGGITPTPQIGKLRSQL